MEIMVAILTLIPEAGTRELFCASSEKARWFLSYLWKHFFNKSKVVTYLQVQKLYLTKKSTTQSFVNRLFVRGNSFKKILFYQTDFSLDFTLMLSIINTYINMSINIKLKKHKNQNSHTHKCNWGYLKSNCELKWCCQ